MSAPLPPGVGVAWRPETAWLIQSHPQVGFTELLAENHAHDLPAPVRTLLEGGYPVVPHGIGLSLGGAEEPDPARLAALGDRARETGAPLVSEHLAFVRAGELDAGHLMPLPRSELALRVLVDGIARAEAALPVPLAVENPASLFEWPDPEMDAPTFLARVLAATGAGLLLDVSNLHASRVNHGLDVAAFLDELPLGRVAYLHIAGGRLEDGRYHDTHHDPLVEGSYEVLDLVLERTGAVPVLLEHDDRFPPHGELEGAVERIAGRLQEAGPRRAFPRGPTHPLPAPTPEDRRVLLRSQVALLEYLVGDGPVPEGFEAGDLEAARVSLGRKKTREARRAGHLHATCPAEADRPSLPGLGWLRRRQ
jgi:uncharacterized protein (UPF0276 family)